MAVILSRRSFFQRALVPAALCTLLLLWPGTPGLCGLPGGVLLGVSALSILPEPILAPSVSPPVPVGGEDEGEWRLEEALAYLPSLLASLEGPTPTGPAPAAMRPLLSAEEEAAWQDVLSSLQALTSASASPSSLASTLGPCPGQQAAGGEEEEDSESVLEALMQRAESMVDGLVASLEERRREMEAQLAMPMGEVGEGGEGDATTPAQEIASHNEGATILASHAVAQPPSPSPPPQAHEQGLGLAEVVQARRQALLAKLAQVRSTGREGGAHLPLPPPCMCPPTNTPLSSLSPMSCRLGSPSRTMMRRTVRGRRMGRARGTPQCYKCYTP